jgi:DNA-binding XRE family transcriptional regulator
MTLVETLAQQFPDARIEVDGPASTGGAFFVNVMWHGRHVVIQYRPARGYGVSAESTPGFGEGPDEVFQSKEDALARASQLLREGGATRSRLRELRGLRGVTQADLAKLVGLGQTAISRMERRDDVSLESLRKIIEALGGSLEVTARFPDGEFPILGEPDGRAQGGVGHR